MTDDPPATWVFRGDWLAAAKGARCEPDSSLAPAFDQLREDAEAALNAGPFSVTFKDDLPPSGDPHDYMSQGPYWWPNPDTADGLPYIRRDGERNPEVTELDSPQLKGMTDAVITLALGYFFFETDRYAEHARTLLDTWFIDEATRMNPHLEFGQRIPGRVEGRGIGIVDTRVFTRLVDALVLLEDTLPADTTTTLQAWFGSYISWLVGTETGRDEAIHPNNHRSRYDKQLQAMARFVGQDDLAAYAAALVPSRHLDQHITPDGRQPHELARTRALSYAAGNLADLFDLARLAEHQGFVYWSAAPRNGGTIQQALDWLVPHFVDPAGFEYEQLTDHPGERAVSLLRRATLVYDDRSYERAIAEVPNVDATSHRSNLLAPPPALLAEDNS